MMKSDELYVKESLERFFTAQSLDITIIDGEDPPDFYALYSGQKILLEVTRTEPIYRTAYGFANRNTNDESLVRLCDQLNSELGSDIDPQKTLCLYIKGPIIRFKKFKHALAQQLKTIIHDARRLDKWSSTKLVTTVEGESVEIFLFDSNPENKRICGIIGIKEASIIACIDTQASLILDKRISIKEQKTKIINGIEWQGEKWLAIFNGYFLASPATYSQALRTGKMQHTFSRIFLVDAKHEVTEIFSV